MGDVMVRLVFDDTGQDLIEYALLTGFVSAVGIAVFPQIAELMSSAYESHESAASNMWEPCPPAPASCS